MGLVRLSIDRPRRIFRSSYHPRAPGRLARVVVAAAGLVGVALLAAGHAGDLLGQMSAEPRVISAPAPKVAVIDGDTLSLAGTVVRLSGVSAPRRGQACAAGPDCGRSATVALADMVQDRGVECHVSGHDGLGRPAGRCLAGGRDLNVALVDAGWARAGNATLSAEEFDARAHKRGIWLAD